MKKQTLPYEGKEDTSIDIPAEKINGVDPMDLMKAGKALNVAILPPMVLKELDAIGVRLDESGVIQTGNKWLCVTGEAVVKCVMLIANGMKTSKDAERVAPVLAQLAKSIATVAGNMSDTVVERGGQGPIASKARAFPAGAPVTSVTHNTQVNIGVPAKPA